jgi:hypothetical protein
MSASEAAGATARRWRKDRGATGVQTATVPADESLKGGNRSTGTDRRLFSRVSPVEIAAYP